MCVCLFASSSKSLGSVSDTIFMNGWLQNGSQNTLKNTQLSVVLSSSSSSSSSNSSSSSSSFCLFVVVVVDFLLFI